MASLRAVVALSLAWLAGPALAQQRAEALLIVNSASPRYADAQRLVRPYLDHFGVPSGTSARRRRTLRDGRRDHHPGAYGGVARTATLTVTR